MRNFSDIPNEAMAAAYCSDKPADAAVRFGILMVTQSYTALPTRPTRHTQCGTVPEFRTPARTRGWVPSYECDVGDAAV
jgi:hypothetical protein